MHLEQALEGLLPRVTAFAVAGSSLILLCQPPCFLGIEHF